MGAASVAPFFVPTVLNGHRGDFYGQKINARLPIAVVADPTTPERPRLKLLPKVRRYIDALVKTELYGWDENEVIRRFIDAGIKDAKAKGDISEADGEAPQSDAQ